jgi:hypothetical protein
MTLSRSLNFATRKRFLEETAEIGIANRAVRLRKLDRVAQKAEAANNRRRKHQVDANKMSATFRSDHFGSPAGAGRQDSDHGLRRWRQIQRRGTMLETAVEKLIEATIDDWWPAPFSEA